jgi:hypothetical protein
VGGAWSANEGVEDHIWVTGGKSRGKETTRRTKTSVDNIKMDLVKIGWGDVDWIGLAQAKSSCECSNKLSGSINC